MKKFIKLAFVAAVVAVAGYNVYQSQSVMNGMSDFALANVEALANDEKTRCLEEQCKSASSTCFYYKLDGAGNICETGEKRPYAYDPYNLMSF